MTEGKGKKQGWVNKEREMEREAGRAERIGR